MRLRSLYNEAAAMMRVALVLRMENDAQCSCCFCPRLTLAPTCASQIHTLTNIKTRAPQPLRLTGTRTQSPFTRQRHSPLMRHIRIYQGNQWQGKWNGILTKHTPDIRAEITKKIIKLRNQTIRSVYKLQINWGKSLVCKDFVIDTILKETVQKNLQRFFIFRSW